MFTIFFITGHHMLDWVYPGRSGAASRRAAIASCTALEICQHLANGAKHFELENPHLNSVTGTELQGSFWPASFFAPGFFAPPYFGGGRLVVNLSGLVETQLGPYIEVVALAEKVMEFWEQQRLS